MAGELQPLSNNFKIVDENGLPTLYFIQWAQQRQIDITAGITAAQALQIATDYVADWAAGRSVFAGAGLDGGGNLSADITIDANASAILDLISNVQGTVLFRGATNWEGLAPGTAGYVFSTNGPAADPTWIAMSGGGGSSIQDLLDMAVAAAADPAFTANSAINAMVTQGDMVALAFYAYCPGTGAVQTSSNQITVPVGKTAVLVRVEQNIQSQVNPSFYAARLWNVTTAAQVFNTAYGADTIPAGYSGSLQPDTANSSISYPRVIGVAGDVIEAHHWTANDGNSRTVTAQYYVVFV